MATPFTLGGLLGTSFGGGLSSLNDLLTEEQRAAIQQQAGLSAAAALLQAAGPSATPTNLGQALGSAFMAGQAGMQRGTESALTQMLTREKLLEARRAKTAREEMQKIFPSVFQVTTTPERQTVYGQPAIGVRDEATGELYPGAEVTPATRQIAIDPQRLQALALLSPNPLESLSQIAKLVPDLRRAGLTTAAVTAGENPFAVYAADTTIPESIRNIAKQYERSYAAGTIDPDKVDANVKALGELAQRAQSSAQSQAALEQQRKEMNAFKEQGLINQQQHQAAMQRLAEQGQALQAQMLQIRRDAEANKPEQFSYAQKKEFDVVQKTAADAKSAQDSAELAEKAAALIPRAYGSKAEAVLKGVSSAVVPGFTADAKKANDDLATLGTQLTLKAPRFSGPTSNYDAQQYAKAVGDLANPSVSQDSKLQAIKDIQDLAKKQADYARQQENYFYANNKSLRGFKFVPSENPFGK